MNLKKLITTGYILLLTIPVMAQLNGFILDNSTQKAIPFVNIQVKDSNLGTSSNRQGKFVLPEIPDSAILFFSAIGYESLQSAVYENDTVFLNPKVYQISQIEVNNAAKPRVLQIGAFDKKKVRHYFAQSTQPRVIARYFPYDTAYQQTPYLKSMNILAKSEVRNAIFNIRLYLPDSVNKPGEYFYQHNILAQSPKGKRKITVDLSPYKLVFPESGFFVALEWILIPENQYEVEFTYVNQKEKHKRKYTAPMFGTVAAETPKNSWILTGGVWKNVYKNGKMRISDYSEKYSLPAVELLLSN